MVVIDDCHASTLTHKTTVMDSMYEKLMGLPLFHGVTYQKMFEIVGKHKFHFLKVADGEEIVAAGKPCTHLKSIISGAGRMVITSKDDRFRVSQTLVAPEVIAPDFFFGLSTRYPGSVVAKGDVGIMQIDKNDYLKIIDSDPVFLFNYLNMLSMNAQLSHEGVLALTSGDLQKRIAYWIIALSQRNGKDIVLECRQRNMYGVFGVQRQSLVAALTDMKEAGALDFTTNEISVIDRRKLVEILMK